MNNFLAVTVVDCEPLPCHSGGTCIDVDGPVKHCACPPNLGSINCNKGKAYILYHPLLHSTCIFCSFLCSSHFKTSSVVG